MGGTYLVIALTDITKILKNKIVVTSCGCRNSLDIRNKKTNWFQNQQISVSEEVFGSVKPYNVFINPEKLHS